ncbi:MAG: response regulator transcription factor [Opitutaceae bacterium]|jgi:two-component system response regulator EvgA
MKIAIVEDHVLTRDFVKKACMRQADVEIVAEAGTGFEAINEIARTKPDVVVLDIGLPDIDGFEVLDRVRQLHLEPKVLVISSGSPYLIIRIEHARVHGFLDKWDQTADALNDALTAFRNNRTFFPNAYLEKRASIRRDHCSFDKLLTNQQMLVLSMVAKFFTAMIQLPRNSMSRCARSKRTGPALCISSTFIIVLT